MAPLFKLADKACRLTPYLLFDLYGGVKAHEGTFIGGISNGGLWRPSFDGVRIKF